jgi:DNA uptake protein ComE-like DNA-binding protein
MPSREQIIGAIALGLMLVATIGILWLVPKPAAPAMTAVAPESVDSTAVQPVLRPFDPNTADSLTLIGIGLTPRQTHSLMQYRRKGGRWRNADDFARLYGLSDSAFQVLRPYIAIDTLPFWREKEIRRALRDSARRADSLLRDSIYRAQYTARYGEPRPKRDTILDLNTADTTELMLIRGIGPFTARRIIRYREQLGGYYSPEQLRDLAREDTRLSGLDTLTHCFVATPDSIRPMQVNYCSVRNLANHPYISFTQAQAIYELRRRKINLKNIDEIKKIDCLSEKDIERLRPYLDFSTK